MIQGVQKEAFEEWKEDPVTKAFFAEIRNKAAVVEESIVDAVLNDKRIHPQYPGFLLMCREILSLVGDR